MTISDPNRAAFVTTEYRTVTVKTDSVKARNAAARELSIDTQLDATSAAALAASYLAENSNPRVFEFEIEGILTPADLVGGPPSYILNALQYATDGRTLKVVSASPDEAQNITLVQVRG